MQYNNFEHEQEQDALAFIANETAHINGITPPSHLSDANVWHQLNKTKNTAFIHSYSKGVLNVTIKTLKHGGESWTFSGWDTVQQCRESNHKPLTRTKPATILTNPQAEATEAEKEKKYRKELALFKTLPKTGAFSYLKRKHILDTAQDTGIGFAANRIMIPIYQPNPNPVKRKGLDVVISGLQIIYSKNKIIRGTKKGGFFPLGDLPKAGSKKQLNIFICEGFATGLAIKKVFHDAVVVVAFDTGNMTIISDLMRKLYSKSMVTIAGDYDGATFAKRGKNPGISAAHKAAYKAIGAKVMLPIVEHGSVQNIDFNDVLIDDENGIIQAYQRRVDCDLKIALAGEYEQHKKTLNMTC
ncbi:DNA primase TraC [Candidatus Venteria ishoeyi]|uniref:DNA primase TraC n=2 Tax=Candidatus Venteria ishoeyi TaxID=1899563 RepID=A0A1H6FBA0_9GAMM|nr:DNA primase TraC [Candidatus Venteria ishoeyi]